MATISWKDGTSGNWSNDSDWNGGTSPGPGDDALINGVSANTLTVTTAITVASITLSDASALLQIENPGALDTVTGPVADAGAIGLDAIGTGGSTLQIGGLLTVSNQLQIGNTGLLSQSLLTAGGLSDTGDITLFGGSAPAVLMVNDSADISGSGLLDVRDGATVTATSNLSVDAGSARLKVDAYGGAGGSDFTIGGDLTNTSFGNFGDGGVSVGTGGMTQSDTLTVQGTIDNTGGLISVTGGQSGAIAQVIVAGAVPSLLTGQFNIVGNAGGARLQYGSGAITQIGDGASSSADLYIDGSNAFDAIGATASNNALDSLAIIAGNGVLDLRDGVTVATTDSLFVDAGSARLKVDAYGGSGGSDVTIGGNLTNTSTGNFGDGGVSVGTGGMTQSDTLTVQGTISNTGGLINVDGGQSGAGANLVVTGSAPSLLTGQFNIVGNDGGASVQYGSGAITQIGDGNSNSGYLSINGPNAFDEIGAASRNNALDNLATIASNGVLDLQNSATVATTDSLFVDAGSARLKVDAYGGSGGSDVTIGGNLTNTSTGNFGDGGVSVGTGGMTRSDTLTVQGTISNTRGLINVDGGHSGANANLMVTGSAPSLLTGQFNIVGDDGGASVQYGSGAITQIGDGNSNSGYLYIDGANAFDEVGSTNSNSALDSLATIASNGVLDLRDGVTVATTGNLFVDAGSARLKVDTYGGAGGSDVTIGGNLTNTSTGSFGDGGVSVGAGGMTQSDTLTVQGTISNAGGLINVTGGRSGASANLVVTGSVASLLTGDYDIVGNGGSASVQYGSGAISQIGDGTGNNNTADLYIDGPNAFDEVGATNSNSALDNLATIASNGLLDLRDGVTITTTGSLVVNAANGRLKIDAYGGSGGSDVTIGGNLTNTSPGSFGDGGVSVGTGGMTQSDALTVQGTLDNTTGIVTVSGGQTGASAQMIITGSVASVLTGNFDIVGDNGGASLQYGSGAITRIGDGVTNGADLYIDGANAFDEIGATNSNSALDNLATIASNGLLDLRDGVTVTTTTNLSIAANDGRLKIDAYGGSGGSDVTIGGNLNNASSGFISDGGVEIGNGEMTHADTLTIHGTLGNADALMQLNGGLSGASAQIFVDGPVSSVLTENDYIYGNAGGASIHYGSGAITQLGDGGGNGADLFIDGPNAFDAVGAADTNSALDNLATIAGNGILDLRDGATVTTTTSLSIEAGDGRLKVDSYGGSGGSDVTIGGNLTNASPGFLSDGGVEVGSTSMTAADTLTVQGTLTNTGNVLLNGNSASLAGQALLIVDGAIDNAGGIGVGASTLLDVAGADGFVQTAGNTNVTGTLLAAGTVAVNGGDFNLSGGQVTASALAIADGARLSGFGTIDTAVTGVGSVIASGGTLDFAGGLAPASSVGINGSSSLELSGPDSGTVVFNGTDSGLILDDPSGFTGTIAGLAVTDTLVLRNTSATSTATSFNAATDTSILAITLAGGGTLDITLAGSYASDSFVAIQSGSDVQIAAVGAAVGVINTPLPVALGAVRQGSTVSAPLSITNQAGAGSAALDASIMSATGGTFGSGTITALAPGATDTSHIVVGIGPGGAGINSGTVTVGFASDLGGSHAAPLPSETVAISGTIFRTAAAAITPAIVFAHVGDPGVAAIGIANTDPADGFSEALIGSLLSVTGSGITIAATVATGDIPAGATNTSALTVDFSTSQAGVVSGSAVVALTTDGGTGAGSIDGLGTLALASQTMPVIINIDNYATAAIQAPPGYGTLTTAGNATTLDLGTIAENSGAFDLDFGVANIATGPADAISGSFAATAASGFLVTGLGSFTNLAAGQTINPNVTIDTTGSGVITQTITLLPTDTNRGGYSAAMAAQTLTVTGTLAVLPPPVITSAATVSAFTTVPTLLNLSVSDPNLDTLPSTVAITDTTGVLTAAAVGDGTVAGNGSGRLILTGDATELNEELATVAYAGAAVGTDTVNITVTDQHHAAASKTVAVNVSLVPYTAPIVNVPTLGLATAGTISGFGNVSLSDPYDLANGNTITLTFLGTGALNITGNSGAIITGQGTPTVTITGTVPQINADLADGLEGSFLESLAFGVGLSNAQNTLYSLAQDIGAGTLTADKLNKDFQKLIAPPTAEDAIAALAGSEGAWFTFGVESASYALNSIVAELQNSGPANPGQFLTAAVLFVMHFAGKGAHVVAPGGILYSMDAVGEFVLAASTNAGDSLLVEGRFQPVAGSSSASELTQVAATVGDDRITFDATRASTVWLNGSALSVALNTPVALSGGTLTEIADGTYQVVYDTGEVMTVTDQTSYLDIQIAPGANNAAGSIVGLAPWASDSSSLFRLPDGTIVTGTLTSQQFYDEFVNAWRVPPSLSLLDYGPGQTTATFSDLNFPETPISLSQLPAAIVAQAASVVAAAGITDAGAAQAAAFDYIVSGGDASVVAADANAFTGLTTTAAAVASNASTVVAMGVLPVVPQVLAQPGSITPAVFDVYLTGTAAAPTVVDYAASVLGTGFLDAGAFGDILPSGSVVVAAGQMDAQFTIDIPAGALGTLTTQDLGITISSPDGSTPVFVADAQETIDQAIPGPPPVPVFADLTNLGSFTEIDPTHYVLDLGQVQAAAPVPTINLELKNAATSPSDNLGGAFAVDSVEGFTVTGASLPGLLGAGASYQGIQVNTTAIKFGENDETITFTPVDSNNSGFTSTLAPITLTIQDTVVPPSMVYSYAYGDVHIITYNGLMYNFQGEGEFTLAKSRVPTDSFDIQMRLQPWSTGASVTVISQVAVSVGTDKVTFDTTRADTVYVDGIPSTVSQSDPRVTLNGGTLTWIDDGTWQVNWNTGEEATITQWGGSFFNISDGIPLSAPNSVGGLQGEDAGTANDFQLADGTVLRQPLTDSVEYGEFADSWRVTQASSLFDYLPGQNTTTFSDPNFPDDVVSLSDLPGAVVTNAQQAVAAAGITDPGLAQAAELDYAATGDPTFLAASQQIASQVTNTTSVTVTNDLPVVPSAGIMASPAGYTEAVNAPTPITFDAYLTSPGTSDIVVSYSVVAAGAGYVDASAFGGTLPSGLVTITAGSTMAPIVLDLPANALGANPSEKIQVDIGAPAGNPVFAPQGVATIANNTAVAGIAPVPQLIDVTQGSTLTQVSATQYALNLGTVTQGQSVSNIELGVANAATAPADQLGGTFKPPTGSGFLISGDDLPGAIAAGQRYTGIYVDPQTATPGNQTETLVFTPADINESGYIGTLTPITLTVTDTVLAPGIGHLNTPSTLVFPNVHVGATDTKGLSVSNTGSGPIAVSLFAQDPILAQGSIATLGAGATDTTSLSVGVNTGTAGAISGIAYVSFGTSDPQVDLFGDVFRLAAGTMVAPAATILHVGDAGTIALDIVNTATVDGFSENLIGTLAAVSTGLTIAAAGPTAEIAAGGSDAATLRLGVSTAQSGTIAGTATIDLTSDGGTGTGGIDGLGTTTLPAITAPVDVTIDNYATAAWENLSGLGTFNRSGNDFLLNLGTVSQGTGDLVIGLGVLNSAAGLADLLSGRFTASGDAAFAAGGIENFSSIAAGQTDAAPSLVLSTTTSGFFTETITLAPTGSNASGFSQALTNETLTVTGSVAPLNFIPAIAAVSPASPIDFGNVHQGAGTTQLLAISNTAVTGASDLDGTIAAVTGSATAIGSFTGLAPGGSSTAIAVGIDTNAAGTVNGAVNLGFVADDGATGSALLASQTVDVTGTVYREAVASLLPLSEIVHVGEPGTASLIVSNTAEQDRYSENLVAMLLSASGDIAGSGSTGKIAAGSSGTLSIGFSTAQAGTISAEATIGLTSDGGIGSESIDGLGTTTLASQTDPVSITVDSYANAAFTSSAGQLTQTAANAYTLDLGTTMQGSGALTAALNVLNNVTGPADNLSGSFAVSTASLFSNSGFNGFGPLGAGASSQVGSISLATSQTGVFSEAIMLTPIDSNASGFTEGQNSETITIRGTIIPTASAVGDVHMMTYDGLHYDFQAVGAYVLTRSTVPGDTFQIQIVTAADPWTDAVSLTVQEAAQVGFDVIGFVSGQANTVWIDGAPDISLTASHPVQELDGGTLTQLSANTYQIAWTTGQVETVTNQGPYLDTSVSDGLNAERGLVQGLLGSDSGNQALDFQLPDGTVLQQPLSDEQIMGQLASAWTVAPGASLLNPTSDVVPASLGTLARTTPQFAAYAAAGGLKVQVAAASSGVAFDGTLADFANTVLAGLSTKNVIDITDFNILTAKGNLAGSSSAGVLYLSDGTQQGELRLAGQLGSMTPHLVSDGHGGALVSFQS